MPSGFQARLAAKGAGRSATRALQVLVILALSLVRFQLSQRWGKSAATRPDVGKRLFRSRATGGCCARFHTRSFSGRGGTGNRCWRIHESPGQQRFNPTSPRTTASHSAGLLTLA